MKIFHKVFYSVILLTMLSFTEIYAQLETGNFFFEGRNRYYKVFLPQSFQPNMPVVFVLHGYLQDATDIIDYTRMSDVADTAGFIAVYPEAVYPGFNSGLKNYPDLPPLPNLNDVGFISALIDTLEAHYDINMNRVYCCGLSNGGIMTYRLVGEIGYLFAAVASVAGSLTDITAASYNQTSPLPILHFHGTADGVVYYYGNIANFWSVEETLNFWIEKNNCSLPSDTISMPDIDPNDGCTVEKISYTNCSDNSCLIFYKVINGGHSWPGSPLDKTWGRPRNMDIHASTLIWEFFKDYERVTSIETKTSVTPGEFCLSQNYPNPFNPSTSIEFSLPKSEYVELKVYNILGKEVMILVSKKLNKGDHTYQFVGRNLASGVYYYQLVAGQYEEVKKMILLK